MGQSPFSGVEPSWSVDQPWCRVTMSRFLEGHYMSLWDITSYFCSEFEVCWLKVSSQTQLWLGSLNAHVGQCFMWSMLVSHPRILRTLSRWAHLCLDKWDWRGLGPLVLKTHPAIPDQLLGSNWVLGWCREECSQPTVSGAPPDSIEFRTHERNSENTQCVWIHGRICKTSQRKRYWNQIDW